MVNRPNIKSWTTSTTEELLARHDELVKKLQDPAYAGIDPSTVKSGSPVHTLDRGTLSSLEAELEKRGATYTPSQGRIIPAPGAPAVNQPSLPIDKPVVSVGQKPPAPTKEGSRQTIEARNANLKIVNELLRDQPRQKQALGDILAELSTVQRNSAIAYGYQPDKISGTELGRKLYDKTVDAIHSDVARGIDPREALKRNIHLYNLPSNVEEATLKRVDTLLALPENFSGSFSLPDQGLFSRDEFEARYKGQPINQPSKPIGKPVVSVGQNAPPPTKAGSQQTAAKVTQSGNATPKPQAAITSTPKPTSTGAPLPATSPVSRSLANNMSEAITKGIKGSGSLKMLGAAALVGLGASAISRRRTQQENIDRRLEMQRRGIIT